MNFDKILPALVTVLQKEEVTSVPMPIAPKAAKEMVTAVQKSADIAIVPVKSAWTSKINWTQAAGLAATAAAVIGLPLTADDVLKVIAGIQVVVAVITWVMKTFFTNSVTAASAGK